MSAFDATLDLDEETRHEMLRSKRRRQILDVLSGHEPPVTTDTVARGITATNGDSYPRLRIELHHVHLPKLDEVGVIDYQPGTKRIVNVSIR